MSNTAVMPTLYEDWRKRRECLLASGTPQGRAYVDVQLRILDYLLKRYLGTPIAQLSARFPAPAELYFNQRAVVVHHHLERNRQSPAENEAQASARASRILQRIVAQDAQGAIKAHQSGEAAAVSDEHDEAPATQAQQSIGFWQRHAWRKIERAIVWRYSAARVYGRIRAALELGPALPEVAVRYLFRRIELMSADALGATELLARCDNRNVLDYTFTAWLVWIENCGNESVANAMTGVFCHPAHRETAAEKLRGALASDSVSVRLAALVILERIGTLDDVGLLLDLLALPAQSDEDPRDREALLHALEALSGAEARTQAQP